MDNKTSRPPYDAGYQSQPAPPPEVHEQHLRHRARRVFFRTVELITIALSFFGRNAIARFIGAKLGLDFIVEVTAHFGADAGHRLSTIVAAIIAEPRLIALIVTGFFLVCHLIAWIVRLIRRRRRPHHPHGHRPPL